MGGCVGGCTGVAVQQLATFFTCNEADWTSGHCPGGDELSLSCVRSAGIDEASYGQCKVDASHIVQLRDRIDTAVDAMGQHYQVRVNGKDISLAEGLKKPLCQAGAKAACADGVMV